MKDYPQTPQNLVLTKILQNFCVLIDKSSLILFTSQILIPNYFKFVKIAPNTCTKLFVAVFHSWREVIPNKENLRN